MNVVLAGGGTAGHVEPALALAEELQARDSGIAVSFLGTAEGLESRLVPARGFALDLVPRVPLPRHPTVALLALPARVRRAVRTARAALDARDADVVVGFGGYVALPAYLAARRRTPVVVHEANARPGLANRVGARFARAVAVSYPGTPLRGAVLTGIPLRRAIAGLDRAALRTEARLGYGLDADTPTLLVFGGSQGARRINEAMVAVAGDLAAAGVQVLHATGAANVDLVRMELGIVGLTGDAPPYVVRDYVDRMDLAYAAADLALCRAGAMTCAELAAVGLPAVYVPLPHGNGEQRLNAAPVVAAGGGVLVDDAELDADWLRGQVLPLLAGGRLDEMSRAAASCGHPGAAAALADLVVAAAGGTS